VGSDWETIGGYNFGGGYHQAEMTAHRPHGLVLIGGNGETWGEASRDKFRKNSPRKGTNISTGGVRLPRWCPDSGGMSNRAAVDHFVYHDSRRALLISVRTVLEQKEKPLKSRGLADDSW